MIDIYNEKIKPLFDKSGLMNKDLEARIGIPEKKISDWNAGRLKSYNKYIPQIASYFNVSVDYLLGNTDDPTPTGQKEKLLAQGEELSERELHLISLFRLVPEERQESLLQTIEFALRSQGLL